MEFQTGTQRIRVNVADAATLWQHIDLCFKGRTGFALATLNLDHLVKLRRDPAFAEAYKAQDYVVADGNPIVWLSRLARQPVELLPGADLVVPLAKAAARKGIKVALVGSTQTALAESAQALGRMVPDVQIAKRISPPFGFDPEGSAARKILADLDGGDIGLCFVALGAPKQEIFAALGRELAPNVGFASIGAGLDFLAGDQVRAPRWVRKLAMEWFYRLLRNPVRLAGRYAACFVILPGLIWRALRR